MKQFQLSLSPVSWLTIRLLHSLICIELVLVFCNAIQICLSMMILWFEYCLWIIFSKSLKRTFLSMSPSRAQRSLKLLGHARNRRKMFDVYSLVTTLKMVTYVRPMRYVLIFLLMCLCMFLNPLVSATF